MKLVEHMASDRLLRSTWQVLYRGLKVVDLGIGTATRAVVFKRTPVERDKIVFTTYNDAYMCNPKYIAEEVIRRGLPYDLVWVVPSASNADLGQYPRGMRLVKRGSYEFFCELASARVWIDNALNCEWSSLEKKPGQIYINTWHGSMGLKRIGKNDVVDNRWRRAAKRMSKYVDYAVSDSAFEDMVYRSTHFPDVEILEYGHPRNDALCIRDEDRERNTRELLASRYGIDKGDKLMIVAPTFRDSGDVPMLDIDFDRLIDGLEERFGGRWSLLVRMHFHDRGTALRSQAKYRDRLVNVTGYTDMQELLAVADAGLTDYSSWCCDYVLTGRPCFLYAPDVAEYEAARGFYYPLSETPFPLAQDGDELLEAIRGFDEAAYARGCAEFLEARGCVEDGFAAKRVVDKIVEVIESSADVTRG